MSRECSHAAAFHLPAEWEPHAATWLGYPHAADTWPGGIEKIFPPYHTFIRLLSQGERVNLLVRDAETPVRLQGELRRAGVVMENLAWHRVPTDDAWCRDYGPCFVYGPGGKTVINWRFNSWGGKYPWSRDARVAAWVAKRLDLPRMDPEWILEGGAVDVNGAGVLLTTESCLLNPNRNPNASRGDIEHTLRHFLGVEAILWLGEGIAGDDTDGHVDDLTRFVNAGTVVTVVEPDPADINHGPLKDNLDRLRAARLPGGGKLDIVELPMPDPVFFGETRLPASYANFYIANAAVVMPTFRCARDAAALDILQRLFERPVVGVDAYDIIQGLGSFHCLSRQEPA